MAGGEDGCQPWLNVRGRWPPVPAARWDQRGSARGKCWTAVVGAGTEFGDR